jgi:hypothetical protein
VDINSSDRNTKPATVSSNPQIFSPPPAIFSGFYSLSLFSKAPQTKNSRFGLVSRTKGIDSHRGLECACWTTLASESRTQTGVAPPLVGYTALENNYESCVWFIFKNSLTGNQLSKAD